MKEMKILCSSSFHDSNIYKTIAYTKSVLMETGFASSTHNPVLQAFSFKWSTYADPDIP